MEEVFLLTSLRGVSILLLRGRGYPELAASFLIPSYRFLPVQCKPKNLFTRKMVFKRPKKACIYKNRDSLYSLAGGVPGKNGKHYG
jgi:hypothetical protein